MKNLSLSEYTLDELHEIKSQVSKEIQSRFSKAPKQYSHPTNPFKKWCGRGRMPKWLRLEIERGKPIEAFLRK